MQADFMFTWCRHPQETKRKGHRLAIPKMKCAEICQEMWIFCFCKYFHVSSNQIEPVWYFHDSMCNYGKLYISCCLSPPVGHGVQKIIVMSFGPIKIQSVVLIVWTVLEKLIIQTVPPNIQSLFLKIWHSL